VFDAERFIFEFRVEFVCEAVSVFDAAKLDVHSIHDSVDFAVFVTNLLILSIFEAFTKCEEILHCLWTNI